MCSKSSYLHHRRVAGEDGVSVDDATFPWSRVDVP